jgi:hypothetical protein
LDWASTLNPFLFFNGTGWALRKLSISKWALYRWPAYPFARTTF